MCVKTSNSLLCHAKYFSSNKFRVKFLEMKKLSSRNISLFLWKNFVKPQILHTLWINEKFTLTENFFAIKYLVILLVKPLLSRNFCWKRVRVNFRHFHTVLQQLLFFFREILWFLLFLLYSNGNFFLCRIFRKPIINTDLTKFYIFKTLHCSQNFP